MSRCRKIAIIFAINLSVICLATLICLVFSGRFKEPNTNVPPPNAQQQTGNQNITGHQKQQPTRISTNTPELSTGTRTVQNLSTQMLGALSADNVTSDTEFTPGTNCTESIHGVHFDPDRTSGELELNVLFLELTFNLLYLSSTSPSSNCDNGCPLSTSDARSNHLSTSQPDRTSSSMSETLNGMTDRSNRYLLVNISQRTTNTNAGTPQSPFNAYNGSRWNKSEANFRTRNLSTYNPTTLSVRPPLATETTQEFVGTDSHFSSQNTTISYTTTPGVLNSQGGGTPIHILKEISDPKSEVNNEGGPVVLSASSKLKSNFTAVQNITYPTTDFNPIYHSTKTAYSDCSDSTASTTVPENTIGSMFDASNSVPEELWSNSSTTSSSLSIETATERTSPPSSNPGTTTETSGPTESSVSQTANLKNGTPTFHSSSSTVSQSQRYIEKEKSYSNFQKSDPPTQVSITGTSLNPGTVTNPSPQSQINDSAFVTENLQSKSRDNNSMTISSPLLGTSPSSFTPDPATETSSLTAPSVSHGTGCIPYSSSSTMDQTVKYVGEESYSNLQDSDPLAKDSNLGIRNSYLAGSSTPDRNSPVDSPSVTVPRSTFSSDSHTTNFSAINSTATLNDFSAAYLKPNTKVSTVTNTIVPTTTTAMYNSPITQETSSELTPESDEDSEQGDVDFEDLTGQESTG